MLGIYTNKDGIMAIVIPSENAIQKRLPENPTDEQRLAVITEIIESAKLKAGENVQHDLVDPSIIPSDRKWRKAWRLDGSTIKADAETAREISLNRLRIKRDAELAQTDIEYVIADSKGDSEAKDAVNARKETLRAATDPIKAWEPSASVVGIKEIEAALAPLEVLPE